ncbi:Na+/H+ antiporter NhaC family protein [Acetohalobium arabaticum]|uniref:Transporter, NhaC family (TC 2.A.35) n=1 Tax=Acetohalobium arabaticum (strain ATCC 49924 / DSM 5501 / Z-7288) TaxID=574087 RepID=D9QUX3_ACEAZ|nr:Na+/H+ antiporter NhaC family protein [Acetohalobium arabaticum]ADL12032.1 transporter, NhaC family (TC 2.A.35) [Acetohalobium arabaticum DSM 5501]
MNKNMKKQMKKWLLLTVGVVAFTFMLSSVGFAGGESAENYGILSIVPPILALTLAFVTRQVVPALFLGVVAGGIITGNFDIVGEYLIPSLGSEGYAQILLVYLWCLGGLIGIWTKTGGAQKFAKWAGKKMVRGRRSAKFFAWIMGVVFHQGGTISTILAGSTVRPICDEAGVSHEELSYIVDSTASPIATLIPFNAWPLYIAGLVAGTIPLIPDESAGLDLFFSAIPYNFYAWIAILFTFLLAMEKLPFIGSKMKKAIKRVKETGKLNRDGADPLASEELTDLDVPEDYNTTLIDFIVPIGTLLGVGVIPKFIVGDMYIPQAFMLSVLSAMVLALFKGMELDNVIDGFVDGAKGVTIGAIILGLAVTLGNVSDSLGTASYIVGATESIIIPVLLPAIYMVLCMFIAFSVGSSWGTYAVMFPIAMPLAYAVNPDPTFITLCFAAVTGGSIYGDQVSPISDTTIMSSLACGADLMDHVYSQIPQASVAAGISMVLYTILTAILC